MVYSKIQGEPAYEELGRVDQAGCFQEPYFYPSYTMSLPLRPKMKVQGLWMQSVGLMLFVADVDLARDSSMTVEAGLNKRFVPIRGPFNHSLAPGLPP